MQTEDEFIMEKLKADLTVDTHRVTGEVQPYLLTPGWYLRPDHPS